jgi:hypothetical protein
LSVEVVIARAAAKVRGSRSDVAGGAKRFADGEDFMYTIFDHEETEVLGGAGLHRRAEADCLEMGYWIRADRVGRGYATQAARALSIVARAGSASLS